jgi:hypothetical protein
MPITPLMPMMPDSRDTHSQPATQPHIRINKTTPRLDAIFISSYFFDFRLLSSSLFLLHCFSFHSPLRQTPYYASMIRHFRLMPLFDSSLPFHYIFAITLMPLADASDMMIRFRCHYAAT